ncbi:AAA family ATPase [Variovorax sp. RB2P76]|uniref:AAA family ATPase n=1 Tax=Variovorax sp. RB2P76 TaxID=3443736 RepID=UPI003F45F060
MRSTSAHPTLIVLSGLPGTGKTTIARERVARVPCVYLRIDVVERAMKTASGSTEAAGPAGYAVAYALARSNLALSISVVADCVNPLPVTREAWQAVATQASSHLVEVEVVCSDVAEHRRRVESREADIAGFALPSWDAVLQHDYEAWATARLVVDSAAVSATEASDLIWGQVRER